LGIQPYIANITYVGCCMLEKLLKDTKFKKDAADIARQLAKVGITTLARLYDAPGLLRSATVWGHPLSEVINAIKEVAERPETPKVTKPLLASLPDKPAGSEE